jgi:ubiquinone/menaquinone biosynthesis C-methylase UbiE
MLPWYQNDEFWSAFGPVLFTTERWQEAADEVESAIKLLDLKKRDRILDLCCGPGRHTLELARRGFQVTGVDRNNQYLRKAKRLAKREGYDCRFVSADMLEYCLPNAYNAVLNLYTSIGYFKNPEDDRRVLGNMYDSLKTGGHLLVETSGREVLARGFQERNWLEKSGTMYLEEHKLSEDWRRLYNRWIRLDGLERKEISFNFRIYSGSELRDYMLEAGFKSVQLFGSLSGLPYDQNANRLVVVADK